jgi:hypothetical protein
MDVAASRLPSVSATAKQTIGCLVLIAVGISLTAAGLVAGFAVDWDLLDAVVHQRGWWQRSVHAIFLVPSLLFLGLLATVIGVLVIRMPAEDPSDER